MRARIFPDYRAMSATAADAVAHTLGDNPSSVFLLPTGTTPLGMYRRLVDMHRLGEVSFSEATFFNLDEYLGLVPDHPASYHVYIEEHFYGLIDADPTRIFVPDGAAPDPKAECERYEAAIRESGGIDVCVLGIGRNGHIGFNEPGAPFDSRTRVVTLSESTRLVNAGDFEANRAPSSNPGRSCSSPRAPTRQVPSRRPWRATFRRACRPRCWDATSTPSCSSTKTPPRTSATA